MMFELGGTSNRAAPPPPPVNDPGSRWQYNVQSPRIDAYNTTGVVNQQSAGDDREQTHARGGHGIFGEPMVGYCGKMFVRRSFCFRERCKFVAVQLNNSVALTFISDSLLY
jgi:hypothetical protein